MNIVKITPKPEFVQAGGTLYQHSIVAFILAIQHNKNESRGSFYRNALQASTGETYSDDGI